MLSALVVLSACTWGFGYNWLTGALLSIALFNKALVGDQTKKQSFVLILLALSVVISPSLGMLYGVLIFVIWITTDIKSLAAAPLALWAIEEFPAPLGVIPFLPIVRILICITAVFLASRIKPTSLILLIICGVLTAIDISKPCRFNEIEEYKNLGYAYIPSNSLWSNLGQSEQKKSENKATLRGYLHGSKVSANEPGVIMVEHDQWSGRTSEPIASRNLQVDVPWNKNCWPGRQYLRYTIGKDGFLSSNLGGMLNDTARVELCYWDHGELKPTIVSRGNTTWCAESDYFNNSLTIYSRWFIPEFNRAGINFYLIRFINLFLASVVVLPFIANSWIIVPVFLSLCLAPIRGDVRIVGGIGDPHDEGGFSGVPDVINTAGLTALPGDYGAKILLVPPGKTGILMNENLVILGGGAHLLTTSGVIYADDIPLGEVDGITDARMLHEGNDTSSITIKRDNGVTIIGSSSPGRLKWKSLYK